jgi:sodium/proline symporter
MMEIELLSPLVIYLLVIVAIGIYASRFSSKGISEYFIGGRQMGRLVVALSAVVSGRSAWLLLGVSGLAYMKGVTAIWAVIGYITIEFLLFIYYAPRIRRFSEEKDCITLPDFYAARFNDKSGFLRILVVIIFIVFMVAYISSQFVAGGKAFSAHLGISEQSGLLITAMIILIYTILGGFLAVSLTDVFQAMVMIAVLIGLPLAGMIGKGGMGSIMMELKSIDGDMLNFFRQPALAIVGLIGIGLGSPGNPHIIVRYMSIRDHTQFKWTAVVGTIWNIIMAIGAIAIGLVGRTYFNSPGLLPDGDEENIYVSLANLLTNPFLAGLIIASIFAAIMSTADSQLLIAASGIVRDVYEKILRKESKIPQKHLTDLSRIVVLMIVIIAVALAFTVREQILWFVLFAWAGLGASIGPTSLLSLFWEKTTREGVIAGLISGSATVFIWKSSSMLSAVLYELIPGFAMALVMTVLVSLLTGRKKQP